MVLHISINAADPQHVAKILAEVLGGEAFPFPPFPNSWIAFTAIDDGSAIEVYPLNQILHHGAIAVDSIDGASGSSKTFVHAAIASELKLSELTAIGDREG